MLELSTYAIPIKSLIEFRKNVLHKNPELSGKEYQTAKHIKTFLEKYKPDEIIEGLGESGIAAVYGKDPSYTVMVRCELDALPIQEINDFEYKSINEGIAHKCGHDGHMTIVAGLATILHKNKPQKGRVVLLFQPAEETGEGATKVINDSKFKSIEPDYIFALHNLPGYPESSIIYREGNFTSSVKSIIIKLIGKTAHAAQPETGINPALAISKIISQISELSNNDPESDDFKLITPIQIKMGEEAYGTSAGYGEIHLTIRCWELDKMNQLEKQIIKIVEEVAVTSKLKIEIGYTQEFMSCSNNKEAGSYIELAAKSNNLAWMEKDKPFKWGEDFGVFTQKYKGAMFGLGAGEKVPALHNPDYDFQDNIIQPGIHMFLTIINNILDAQ